MTHRRSRIGRILAALLIRGAEAPFILRDLDDACNHDVARGLAPAEVRRRDLRNIVASAANVWAESLRLSEWRPSVRDLRHAWRLLRRQPAFAAVAILTLALGIGTTTAVFTIVNGVLLRPLPYRDPNRLVILYYGHQGSVSPWFSPLNLRDYVRPSESFAEASAIVPVTVSMTGLGDPERLQGARVSWNYFKLLGVSMALGRALTEGDAQGDGSQIVLVSALLSRLEAEAGVESAAVAMGLPFTSDLNAITGFRHEGQAEPDSASMPTASMRIVSSQYFETMKIPIRAGRSFDRRDTATSPEVALINERAAQRFFSGQNPVGRQIRVSAALAREARRGPKTIVGVVGNIKYRGLDEDTLAEIYLPYEQHPVDAFTIAVRTSADLSIPMLRHAVAALDPLLPLANIKSLAALVDASLAERRFTMLVLMTFAVIAVALSGIGVYGVLAYLVGQRRREIGLRLAIGASPGGVVWLFVREGVALTLVGLGVGLAGALAAGRWISALLFGVTPADPVTLAIVACALAGAAALATYVPARRAADVDPTDALRAE